MAARITIRQGSLTDGDESVLVNASNTNVQLGSGVSGAIRRACGPDYQRYLEGELQRVYGGPMPPGTVLLTGAGAHPRARWVAHVAVMDYRKGAGPDSRPTLDTVRLGCEMLWDTVEQAPDALRHSVAMVALGAGTGGLGVAEPTRIAAETLRAHFAIHPQTRIDQVTFYGFTLTEYFAMAEVLFKHFPDMALPDDVRSRLQRRPS